MIGNSECSEKERGAETWCRQYAAQRKRLTTSAGKKGLDVVGMISKNETSTEPDSRLSNKEL